MTEFKEAKRQSPVAILLILYKVIRLILRQSLPILIVLILNPKGGKVDYVGMALIAISIVSAISSIMSYYRFFYFVDDTHFHIRKGWLVKSNISIPIERIQTIDFSQNPLHKIFNVVQLDIDTAGSANKEIHIDALTLSDAEQLRSFLYMKRGKLRPLHEESELEVEEEEQVLHKLDIGDLIKIGLVQNHLRTAGIIIAFGFTIYGEIREIFEKATDSFIEESYGMLERSGIYVSLILLLILLILSILGSIIVVVSQNYDLKFIFSGKGYKLTKGLLNKKQTTISLSKIQMLRWSSNYLQRRFSLVNLSIYQASSIIVNIKKAIYVPGLNPDRIQNIAKNVFPSINIENFQSLTVSKLIIIRQMITMTILPLVIIIISNLDQVLRGILIAIVWLGFSLFWSIFYYRNFKINIYNEGIQIKQGVLTHKGAIMEWKNIQSIALKQSPIQKRRQLTNVVLYSAAGSMQIPFIDIKEAEKLRDFVIFRVENSQKEWM
jgi:putative membrane protein